jgi:hypothetical protein
MNQPAPVPPAPARASRKGLVLKIAALAVVAVIAGLVWLVVKPTPAPTSSGPTSAAPAGEFTFTPAPQLPGPLHDSKCSDHAYGKTKDFLAATPCQQMVRALYTTTTPDGRTVYTSVSAVRMRSAEDATKLREITAANNTGNVTDLVKDGAITVPGLPSLGRGGYASQVRDTEVFIVESDTPQRGPDETEHVKLMKRISSDAFRLAAGLS